MEHTEEDLQKSPILTEKVEGDTPLKDMILQYVGERFDPKDDKSKQKR